MCSCETKPLSEYLRQNLGFSLPTQLSISHNLRSRRQPFHAKLRECANRDPPSPPWPKLQRQGHWRRQLQELGLNQEKALHHDEAGDPEAEGIAAAAAAIVVVVVVAADLTGAAVRLEVTAGLRSAAAPTIPHRRLGRPVQLLRNEPRTTPAQGARHSSLVITVGVVGKDEEVEEADLRGEEPMQVRVDDRPGRPSVLSHGHLEDTSRLMPALEQATMIALMLMLRSLCQDRLSRRGSLFYITLKISVCIVILTL